MFTKNPQPKRARRGPGRPKGPTSQGEATRRRLYETAVALLAERGYEAATLREVAQRAGVSAGLLYRYFPSKRAVVLALYEELSGRFAARAEAMPRGPWRTRFLWTLEESLATLAPHRAVLGALVPVLVATEGEGVLSEHTAQARERVEGMFHAAVTGATDAPRKAEDAEALGRVLYAVHLAALLGWLLDRSVGQRATREGLALLHRLVPAAALTLRLPRAWRLLHAADGVVREGLLGDSPEGRARTREER